MRSLSFIISKRWLNKALAFAFLCVPGLIFSSSVNGQKLAVIAADTNDASRKFAGDLSFALSETNTVLDTSLSEAAYRAIAPTTPLNMTTAEAKTVGSAIGCDLLFLVRSDTLRRSSFDRAEYYESYAAVYAVSSLSGRLVYWSLPKFEAANPAGSVKLLSGSISAIAADLAVKLKRSASREALDEKPAGIEELPPENSPEAKNFRAPIPFRRIKPEYTNIAFLFDITATVEIELDLDATGKVLRTEIVRWAGFGLDESVETAVRTMNWRPAERNGKFLPMRVLLRYNFKKIDK